MPPWKDLERYVAKFFGGKRIRRGDDFGASRPDVIAPSNIFTLPGTLLIECKYSKSQPWVDLILNRAEPIVIDEFSAHYFWLLENTRKVINFFRCTARSLYRTPKAQYIPIGVTTRKVPDYIEAALKQANDYTIDGWGGEKPPVFSMVVLGKKHSPHRLCVMTQENVWQIIQRLQKAVSK
jgi:hypothetical protein